ncbi:MULTISPECIES: nickel pincer cofactor biosynthesis protein LarC [Anaeromyxobacter]|uniref:nickel pincer cofactor biosynthesis protein LarC n=1 Tax=Anaeromyxobacter TaxID=161492 RepID=UPI001F55B54A|nr:MULTISPECIES: nickel pincer cofactor biosynthesis protein LarC [unclassified Anaeromyxobacter]
MQPLLVLEPIGGIAGDMFLAAALDLGVDRARLEEALRSLGVPGWRLEVQRRSASAILGTHVDVVVEGQEPPARSLSEILGILDASALAPRVKAAARGLFERIGRAEAKVHGVPVEEVHFHEVGAVDSIVDLCGAAVALDLLGWPRVVSAPPELGRGIARTAHGPVPIPPPAVLELLAGTPVRPGGPPGEAVTPTGAALLAEFAQVGPLPPFVPRRIGHGVGTVTWPDRPNVLRMTLAEEVPLAPGASPAGGAPAEAGAGALWVLEANLDDCPGQLVARAIEAALEAGALDAWAAPLTMKKGRPGMLLGALCEEPRRAAVTQALFAETTTLGVRRHAVERDALERTFEQVETPYGVVRVKVAWQAGRELGAHPEYDDCLARARERGVPVREVMSAAIAAHRAGR